MLSLLENPQNVLESCPDWEFSETAPEDMSNLAKNHPLDHQVETWNDPSPPLTKQFVRVVLPAYNEGKGLPLLLEKIQQRLDHQSFQYEVIVVDDGSTDDTFEVARFASLSMPVRIVPHEHNRGLAAALRTGFNAAIAESEADDLIVTMDADNTHPVGLIPAMVSKVNCGFDVVVASRFVGDARVMGVPWFRQLTSIGAAWLFRILFPIRGIRDYTCGFRAYKSSVLRRAAKKYGDQFISETGFSCMVDVLLKLAYVECTMTELPMVLRYDLKDGESKMEVGSTIWSTLKLAWKRRLGVMD